MIGLLSPLAFCGTFSVVGTHADANAQSTATGKTLSALAAFNGKLYAGFGDYNSNTGPIGIRPFNPANNTFGSKLLTDQTEAVYQFREIGGKLYAPDIDPKAGESSGGYALGTANGSTETWTHKAPVTAVHMYDVASYGGSLWMSGAQGNNATVWRSTDNGATWSLSLNVLPSGGYSYVRSYGMGVYNNKLYTTVDGEATKSHVFDGTSWSDGVDLTPSGGYMSNASVFAGKMIYQSSECGLGNSRLYGFDGVSASFLDTDPNLRKFTYDYKTYNGALYTLDGEYTPGGGAMGWTFKDIVVRRTWDLVTWDTIAVAPSSARSLAILNDQLYLGASAAQIYKYSESVPEPTTLTLLAAGVVLGLRRRAVAA